ncbi:RimK family protein [candidate division KSB1 bacterium]|nr:RimK family protein [candidate division KSB1 bacterium]
MSNLIVVDKPKNWPLEISGVKVVPAREYLTNPLYSELRGVKVFNLCRSYRYQSNGYYVSLLAEARGHKPLPNVATILDLKSQTVIRIASDELDDIIQKSLKTIQSDKFVLSIYFGRNVARKYKRLALHLFNLFQAPLLRAYFVYKEKWELQNIETIDAGEIPDEHRPFVVEVASEYFGGRRISLPKRENWKYDLAILYNPDEPEAPSDEKAIEKFVKAAEALALSVELITKDDFGRLAEYDALFIRETTNVNHHTYRFSQRATAEGLFVIDDPESILKCANKVYLAELLTRYKVPIPKTMMVHKDNLEIVSSQLGFPMILKQPDSAFSQGVLKVKSNEEFLHEANRFLEKSELLIAQEFMPTQFDWRIGIINNEAIYACKYYMASGHWQIINNERKRYARYGKAETIPIELAPKQVVRTALKAANLIGDGLYGVDVKEIDSKCYVVEVNDNPSIDAGVEDAILKDKLYAIIMNVFLQKLELSKR